MDTTLTKKNLVEIYNSMSMIKEIDRSDFFKNYFNEIKWRLEGDHGMKFINCEVCNVEYDENTPFNYSGTCANCVD